MNRRNSLSHGIDMETDGRHDNMEMASMSARPTSFVVPSPAPSSALELSHLSSMTLMRSLTSQSQGQGDGDGSDRADESENDGGIHHAPASLLQMLQRPAAHSKKAVTVVVKHPPGAFVNKRAPSPPVHKHSITISPAEAPRFEDGTNMSSGGESPSLTTFSSSLSMLLAAAKPQTDSSASASSMSATALTSSTSISSTTSANKSDRFKPFHEEKWSARLDELRQFRARHGHCLVPHQYPDNLKLACWVKRQRRQYKLMKEGRTSTMSPERIALLEEAGFVWDSHDAGWSERFIELKEYRALHGNCLVPSTCRKNPQLAVWVKCQRRQHKLWKDGKPSSMTEERRNQLEGIGFCWEARPAAMHPPTV